MKITDITVTLFAWDDIPATQYGRHSGRFSGKSDLGLVTIKTDQGVEGHAFLGSSSRPASGGDANLIVKIVKPMLVGENPLDRERHFQRMWARMRMNNQLRALGAVDVALWDLAGKIANMPVHQLMGSYRTSVPAYASSSVLPSAEAYCEEALSFKARGWTAYKIHPPTEWQTDIRICEAVRKAVGDDYRLMLDSTWSYSYVEALRVGQAIERLGYYWYEDPLVEDDLTNYVKLRAEAFDPHSCDRVRARRPHGLCALAHSAGDRLSARRRRREGRAHRLPQDRPPRRGLPHELRGAPRRQLAQQRGKPPPHHGDQELRVFRGAAAGRRPEIRAHPGHRGRRQGPRPRH